MSIRTLSLSLAQINYIILMVFMSVTTTTRKLFWVLDNISSAEVFHRKKFEARIGMGEYEMYKNTSHLHGKQMSKTNKRSSQGRKGKYFHCIFSRFIVIGFLHWRLGINFIRRIDEVVEFRLQKPLNLSWRVRAALGFKTAISLSRCLCSRMKSNKFSRSYHCVNNPWNGKASMKFKCWTRRMLYLAPTAAHSRRTWQ